MTTVLLNDDNELIVTKKERIMQRSKNVDNFQVLVPLYYKTTTLMLGYDCTLEYLLPISKKYVTETLTVDTDLYEDTYLRFELPFDTNFTAEAGNVQIQITLSNTVANADGTFTQYIRKTSTTNITIVPISAWSDIIPDESLTAVDQKILQLNELLSELNDTAAILNQTKADNIQVGSDTDDSKYISLTASGSEIGNKIKLSDLGEDLTEATDDGLVKMYI